MLCSFPVVIRRLTPRLHDEASVCPRRCFLKERHFGVAQRPVQGFMPSQILLDADDIGHCTGGLAHHGLLGREDTSPFTQRRRYLRLYNKLRVLQPRNIRECCRFTKAKRTMFCSMCCVIGG